MLGSAQITDELVAAAVADTAASARERIAQALFPQVRTMVTARLAANPDRVNAVEDIAQQAMLAVHAGLDRLENRTVVGLKAFVSRIVANKVVDHLRRKPGVGKAPLNSLDSAATGFSEAMPLWQLLSASGTSPLSAVARSDDVQRLFAALGRLKEEHREIITLAFFDQLPTSEIAAELGITRPAASMRVIRAVEALRRDLTGASGQR
ncbi:MAG: sigma-70 family RNA polymerase sigma factor [Phycisphaerae bacterium]|nr:sigma-70 family RNA polymerase sigma factor [Phycisphaerae bacterium]